MGDIAEIATRVLSTSLILTSTLLLFLTYYSTGAPGARFELLTAAVEHIHRLNGGPVTWGQQAKSIVASALRSVVTWRVWMVQDEISWARSTEKACATADDVATRAAVYRILATASGRGHRAESALADRERRLTARVLDGADLESTTSLAELQRVVTRHDRRRLWWLTLHPAAAVEPQVMHPIYAKGLDSIGRGTSLGLLIGVLVAGSDSVADMVAAAGTASLVGAAAGSIHFCGTLIRLIPDPPSPRSRVRALLCAHPTVTAAAFPLAVVALLTAAQWVTRGLAQLFG